MGFDLQLPLEYGHESKYTFISNAMSLVIIILVYPRSSFHHATPLTIKRLKLTILNLETTTTPPPGCIVGNLDNRVCRLEDQFEEFDENFQAENSRLNSVTEGLRSEIEVLRREKLELEQNMAAAVEDLQKQINDLANKTCGCR